MPSFDHLQVRRLDMIGFRAGRESQRTIWHGTGVNEQSEVDRIGQYYISFHENAARPLDRDALGIPILKDGRRMGTQYDPMVVAQWGLRNHDLFKGTGSPENRQNFMRASDWICDYLNRDQLCWHPGSGQGISLLVRAHAQTGEQRYREAADRAFAVFLVSNGGGDRPASGDSDENVAINGSVDSMSTRCLSEFIWSAWGIYDYFLANGENAARDLFARAVNTVASNVKAFDVGFWSRYERTDTWVPNVASYFYHELHINQMRVMFQMTGTEVLARAAERWRQYTESRLNRVRALTYRFAWQISLGQL
jgi:heparosan-N-sulfate-glucuronate 5-epimerase